MSPTYGQILVLYSHGYRVHKINGRFIARRGKPRTICSDNGTNFQGAANELHAVYKMLQSTSQMASVQDFLANERCEWKFIPPHGLHFGGLWEAAVKAMKYHLR